MKQLSQIYLLLLLVTMLNGCTTIGYYSQAVSGHTSLMVSGQRVAAVIADDSTPAELREKLAIAQQAREFAAQRLGLPVGDAFREYVNLDRPWVVVNLVAAPEFSLEPHRWCYPILGCQAYRGYFSLEAAKREQASFRAKGFDTFIGGVTAYSTLGWFDDPLHTGFTRLPEDRMVALMFHELAHQVVYIADDTAFNESFATAVELEGLRLWLVEQGKPGQFRQALERLSRLNQTLALVQAFSTRLEALYEQQGSLPDDQLRSRKADVLEQLAQAYQQTSEHWPEPGPLGPAPVTLNNANLALFRQYNQHVPAFRQLLRENGYDFAGFYPAVDELSQKPEPQRSELLTDLSKRFKENL
ncbi:aminopeptidase [Marinobacter sp.]|uniref:aminopeptidase n=1 Tax=Marinobacter sp. TaxID=50741 RepID=UPI003A943E81